MGDEAKAAEVLLFWFGGPAERGTARKAWFAKDPQFDRAVRERFLPLWESGARGALSAWKERADDCLALIVLLDQFPRNMFRGTPRAFASDVLALEAARHALARGYDRALQPVERLFVYLPFEHSESLDDQELACRLTEPLEALAPQLEAHRYALAHRDIVRRFGRFPHRNAVLGRDSTPEELEFLKGPGSSF